MKKDKMNEVRSHVEEYLINEFGHYVEAIGGKTLMGRVWALLITRSEPVSLKEMSEVLQVSKPALSNTLNIAVQMGLFNKVYMPDFPRESFFRLGLDSMAMMVDPGIHKLNLLMKQFENALELLDNEAKDQEFDDDLIDLHKRIEYMNESMRIVLNEYNEFGDKVKSRISELQKKYKGGKL